MAAPLVAPMPYELIIGVGYIVRLTAYDAATGNLVTGVSISTASIQAAHLAGPLEDATPMPLLVPSDSLV